MCQRKSYTDHPELRRLAGTMVIFLVGSISGCGGAQTDVHAAETCQRELSSCQFTVDNLRTRSIDHDLWSEQQKRPQAFLMQWQTAFGDIRSRFQVMCPRTEPVEWVEFPHRKFGIGR